MPDLHCPLTLQVGYGVKYMLIARVLYLGPTDENSIGHYITRTRLKNGGLLTELGPLHLLEDLDAKTCFVLYLRTSKASITSRAVAEIQEDFAKIPEQPDEIIQIPDSDDELDQMLLDSVASPAKKGLLASPSPAPLPYDIPNVISRMSDETKSATPSPVFCEPCGASIPEGDDDPDEVQCEKCKFWSHFKCYPGVDWNDTDERFFCGRCREELAAQLILADWNNRHPVIASLNEYFGRKKTHMRNLMDTLGLVLTLELEAFDGPSRPAQTHCQTRVIGVGSVLLQLLAIQHELGEPLNLNGDLIEDLKDECVVACVADGTEALNAMFSAITTSTSTRSDVLVQQMLAFKRDHTIFDEELRPPLFRRDRPSYLPPTERIPVEIKGTLKRKGGDGLDDEKPMKRAKSGPKKAHEGGGSKCKRDDESERNHQNARKPVGRRRGRVRVKSRPKSPPRQPAVGAVAGKIKYSELDRMATSREAKSTRYR
ncbi:hypothetical protein DFH08DRAFT_805964 [Mycena albidolilacea]|uniref:PHD-type domain-containing protein n=1 Tax=Mycena albidolilacea TaxID=1033008 RepID=A0AAD7ETZ9_9AGAR|nr:hypothetical protein DFH08DRAFT_805964 [Mycena albidolilacea]